MVHFPFHTHRSSPRRRPGPSKRRVARSALEPPHRGCWVPAFAGMTAGGWAENGPLLLLVEAVDGAGVRHRSAGVGVGFVARGGGVDQGQAETETFGFGLDVVEVFEDLPRQAKGW